MTRSSLRLLPLVAAALLACGPPTHAGAADAGKDEDAGPEFVARQGDFAGFPDWPAFDGGSENFDSLDGGNRRIYMNRAPPPGSTAFPEGTIFVKTTEGDATFAMAKRGGKFNPTAFNWEWFELTTSDPAAPLIKWRGKGPDSTPGYGETPPTGCTGCHLTAFRNDFVAGPVHLSDF
jgi:hypothetical protein